MLLPLDTVQFAQLTMEAALGSHAAPSQPDPPSGGPGLVTPDVPLRDTRPATVPVEPHEQQEGVQMREAAVRWVSFAKVIAVAVVTAAIDLIVDYFDDDEEEQR